MEDVFSTIAVFVICGMLGVVIAYIIPKISSANYLFKCWLFSIAFWVLAFIVTVLYKVPGLTRIPGKTAIINFILATIWGLSLGYCLKWFDCRIKG